MALQDFWEDHPLWIWKAIGKRPGVYMLIHIVIAYLVWGLFLPFTGTLAGLGETGSFPGFMAFAVGGIGLIAGLYILFFLPVRVCGHEDLAGYLCIPVSLITLWFFI